MSHTETTVLDLKLSPIPRLRCQDQEHKEEMNQGTSKPRSKNNNRVLAVSIKQHLCNANNAVIVRIWKQSVTTASHQQHSDTATATASYTIYYFPLLFNRPIFQEVTPGYVSRGPLRTFKEKNLWWLLTSARLLQAGCPSRHPDNSVKELKGWRRRWWWWTFSFDSVESFRS